jgi:hypothetical protein
LPGDGRLIADAIDIISAFDDPDCEAWLNQARAELGVLRAKAQLREALSVVEGPVVPAKVSKPAKSAKAKQATADSKPKPTGNIVSTALVTA